MLVQYVVAGRVAVVVAFCNVVTGVVVVVAALTARSISNCLWLSPSPYHSSFAHLSVARARQNLFTPLVNGTGSSRCPFFTWQRVQPPVRKHAHTHTNSHTHTLPTCSVIHWQRILSSCHKKSI